MKPFLLGSDLYVYSIVHSLKYLPLLSYLIQVKVCLYVAALGHLSCSRHCLCSLLTALFLCDFRCLKFLMKTVQLEDRFSSDLGGGIENLVAEFFRFIIIHVMHIGWSSYVTSRLAALVV